jgi:hypothetical protein
MAIFVGVKHRKMHIVGLSAGHSGWENKLPLSGLHKKYKCSDNDVDIYAKTVVLWLL